MVYFVYIYIDASVPGFVTWRSVTAFVTCFGPCRVPGRCNCCLQDHGTLLQRSWTLQLPFPSARNATATLLQCNAAVSKRTQRSCNAFSENSKISPKFKNGKSGGLLYTHTKKKHEAVSRIFRISYIVFRISYIVLYIT